MAKPPPKFGPIAITKGRMETGDQFFARRAAERGAARLAIDEALAASLDALDADLTFFGLEADRALVLKERDDNPDGTKPLSLEAQAACTQLVSIGEAARAEVTKRAQAKTEARAAAEIEAARAEAETAERERARADAERAAARAEAERAAQAEANRAARAKAWSSQGGQGRTAVTWRGVLKLEAFFEQKGLDINILKTYDEHNTSKKKEAAKALGVTLRTIDRYVAARFPEKKQKRRPRPPPSETPQKKFRHIVRIRR